MGRFVRAGAYDLAGLLAFDGDRAWAARSEADFALLGPPLAALLGRDGVWSNAPAGVASNGFIWPYSAGPVRVWGLGAGAGRGVWSGAANHDSRLGGDGDSGGCQMAVGVGYLISTLGAGDARWLGLCAVLGIERGPFLHQDPFVRYLVSLTDLGGDGP